MKNQQELAATFKRIAISALCATALLFATPASTAGGQVPFKAVFDTEFDSSVVFPIASVHVFGAGKATLLGGTLTETTDQSVNLISGAGTATYHFVAANGDTVTASFTFSFVPAPGGFTLNGTWTITGGTGRFIGASGSGVAVGTVEFRSETTGVGHFSMDGTISSPGRLK